MLKDRIKPGVRILFVGINPGMRSDAIGHHFAGYSNRFWKLLYESRIVPAPIRAEDDDRLPEWGIGITNLVARATPGIDSLRPDEYIAGAQVLRKKIKRYKPEIVALVGVTVFRSLFGVKSSTRVALGPQPGLLEGSRVFVLPNPSGRNANFTLGEMLGAFRALRRATRQSSAATMSDHDLQIALGQILDRAIDATAADFGNIQLLSPKDGSLRIAVQRGFEPRFLEFFRVVKNDLSACASALKEGRRVVVRDVRRSALYTDSARREMLKAGAHSCQSTPVQARDGSMLAMISTHYRTARVPTRAQLARVDVLARHAADVIERARRPGRVDVRKTIEELHDNTPAKSRAVRG